MKADTESKMHLLAGPWMILCAMSAAALGADRDSAMPVSQIPEELKGIGIEDRLGTSVDRELSFVDENGVAARLGDVFHPGKPVILSLAYYECPNLCSMVLNGLIEGVKGLKWVPGQDYELLNVSIDPKEGPALAKEKRDNYLHALGRSNAKWHFWTGSEQSIKKLASAVGFGYRYDEKAKQYAHGAGVFILTPEGKLSRTLFGIQFRPQDLKLALVEASSGKVGSVVDRLILFCFSYDPQLRRYSLVITRILQVAAGLTVLALAFAITWMRRRERHT